MASLPNTAAATAVSPLHRRSKASLRTLSRSPYWLATQVDWSQPASQRFPGLFGWNKTAGCRPDWVPVQGKALAASTSKSDGALYPRVRHSTPESLRRHGGGGPAQAPGQPPHGTYRHFSRWGGLRGARVADRCDPADPAIVDRSAMDRVNNWRAMEGTGPKVYDLGRRGDERWRTRCRVSVPVTSRGHSTDPERATALRCKVSGVARPSQ